MLLDLETLDPQTPLSPATVCIIGGGIAGTVLSERLSRGGIDVLVLEAGGTQLEERSQSLYNAIMAQKRHAGTTEGRFRVLGGSSTRWGGQLLPYTEDIFHPPAFMQQAGWPIDAQEIEQYYAEVQSLLGADDLPFDASLLQQLGLPPVSIGSGIRLRFSKWLPFVRRNVANTFGKPLQSSDRVRIVQHANVTRLIASQDGSRIEAAEAVDYQGRTFLFTAQHFIITTGTIESSRLMLLSHLGGPATGKFFHDHVSLQVGEMKGDAKHIFLEKFGPFFHQGTLHTCKLEATRELREEHRLPAIMAHILIQEPDDSGNAAVRNLLQSLQRGEIGSSFTRHLMPLLRNTPDIVRLAWATKVRKRRGASSRAKILLTIDMEQSPRPEMCIRLSDETDALGLRRAIVDWNINDDERRAVRTFARLVAKMFDEAGLPQPEWYEGILDDEVCRYDLADTYHPMGGLRMGQDAEQSVVDSNLKVHGVENLSISSCSVYPTGGSSNPTFTMVALSMRLADRLLSTLKRT